MDGAYQGVSKKDLENFPDISFDALMGTKEKGTQVESENDRTTIRETADTHGGGTGVRTFKAGENKDLKNLTYIREYLTLENVHLPNA